jgi:twitching motility protein PilT
MLRDRKFSDLILYERGVEGSLLKGTLENGFKVSSVPEEDFAELRNLLNVVSKAYLDCDAGLSLRISHGGIFYRSALFEDTGTGRVFFLRRLPASVPDFADLGGLPERAVQWVLREDHSKGLLLFSGAQASGKTTSAAAYIAARLRAFGGHAITFEHPVEMPLAGKHGPNGVCFQREIASESELPQHIERTHRYASPNIVFIGEIRTEAAASEALRVALGSERQLVVATIHGIDLTSALSRMLTWATAAYGTVARQDLSEVLAGVIHQRLVQDSSGAFKLEVPELLLMPFAKRSSLSSCVKLREGNLSLHEEMRDIRNRLMYGEGDLFC